jgi:AcrR family transcriptional regulator
MEAADTLPADTVPADTVPADTVPADTVPADTVPGDSARVLDPAGPPDAPMGLRERKKLETFRALQGAARRLVGERGLANVTVDEIADAANVSKRTFFNYFESKEAAIVDPELGKVERLAAELAARPASETPLEALWAATLVVLERHAAGLEDLSGLIAANPTLAPRQVISFARYRKVIVDWAAARTECDPETNIYPELLAGVAGVMNHLSVTRWQPESGEEGHIRLADEIFAVLAGGLAAPSAER